MAEVQIERRRRRRRQIIDDAEAHARGISIVHREVGECIVDNLIGQDSGDGKPDRKCRTSDGRWR